MKFDLYFRPANANETDASIICQNRNHNDRLFLEDSNLYSVSETLKWLQNLSSKSKRIFVCNANNYEIGLIRIDKINHNNSCCEIGLDIFESFKGKGMATQIYHWLLNHLFNDLGFHSVYLEVLANNDRAIHIYKKLGFKETGRFPERIWRNGAWIDYLHMTLLQRDYHGPTESFSNG